MTSYEKAEQAVEKAREANTLEQRGFAMKRAQVFATLALCDAIAEARQPQVMFTPSRGQYPLPPKEEQ